MQTIVFDRAIHPARGNFGTQRLQWGGARVDPLSLIAVTKESKETSE